MVVGLFLIYPLRLLSAASVHGVGLLTRTWTDSQNLHDQKEQTFPLRIVRHWWQLLGQMGVHMSPSLSHAWILSGLILCGPVQPVIGVLVIRAIVLLCPEAVSLQSRHPPPLTMFLLLFFVITKAWEEELWCRCSA